MEKQCEICGKNYNAKRKKQRFCSTTCQYESLRKPKIDRVSTTCNFCGLEFSVLPNDLLTGRGKYCCRECKDSHQKITYSGVNNPTYGKIHSEDRKKNISDRTKELWKTEEYRSKIKEGVNRFIEKNGYYPGADDESKRKRKETMIERYGLPHNWVGNYGKRKCDETTKEKYGKTSVEMLMEYSHYYGKKTDIEKIFEKILEELEIPYQCKFRIYDKEKVNFWYREYDFLIMDTNILVEVDGDYWHGNENIFEEITEQQKIVQNQDIVKENFAKSNGYDIIRFWGTDIKRNSHEVKNKIKNIWEKLK